jgi:uncharacterized membrane protein HdeD (DUF308 family)
MNSTKPFKNWWLLTLKGILAIVFGVFAITMTGTTLLTLMTYFGIVIIVGGILLIFGSATHKSHNSIWKNWLYEGVLDIIIGLVIIIFPKFAIDLFVIILAIWAISVGFSQLFNAMNANKENKTRWMLLLNALIVIVFSIVLFINPFEGAVAVTYLIGIFAIIFGFFITLYSINLKNLSKI